MRRFATLLAAMALFAGCAAGNQAREPVSVDVAELLRTLPTPRGFEQSSRVEAADAADIQRIFAQGTVNDAAVRTYESIGFEEAAVRRWRATDGATFTIVASRWGNHQSAANVGGGAAEQIPLARGAQAWTPSSLRGARGTTSSDATPPVTTLSVAIGGIDVFIITSGLEDTAPVVRTMDLATTVLGVE